MPIRPPLKSRFPLLHRALVPIYWSVLRRFMIPALECKLEEAFERKGLDPEWHKLMEGLQGAISTKLHPRDEYIGSSIGDADHYARTSLSALQCTVRGLETVGRTNPNTILDLPCGYGRVMRLLRAGFPKAQITACDIDPFKVSFCEKAFGATGVISKDSPEDLSFGHGFDLIWCGSFLTHLERALWASFLELFERHLNPNGILIVTTHGSGVAERIRTGQSSYSLDEAGIRTLFDGYERDGFGFSRHVGSSKYYGTSLTTREFVIEAFAVLPTLTLVWDLQKGWDEHQDVFVFQHKEAANAPETFITG